MDGATVRGSLIADGCRIDEGAVIENSVIGLRCIIGKNVVIKDSVVMGADYYQTKAQGAAAALEGAPPLGIGDNSVVEGAILDKNCRIGSGVRIVNTSGVIDDESRKECPIRDGIPVVVKNASLPDGWQL